MPTTYYIWKWAANNASGRPSEVVCQLDVGDLPEALQAFHPKRVLDCLKEVETEHRSKIKKIQIASLGANGDLVKVIRIIGPSDGDSWLADKLLWAVWKADLTLCNATINRLLGLPKCNVVELPGGRQLVDIARADIPGLLHRLAEEPSLAALACYDRNGNMFQVWVYARRYAVEWQILPERDFNQHQIWVAGHPTPIQRRAHFGSLENGLELFSRELLKMAEVCRLWSAFLAGEQRPASYLWRDVTRGLDSPGQPPRHRHKEPETVFPGKRFFGEN